MPADEARSARSSQLLTLYLLHIIVLNWSEKDAVFQVIGRLAKNNRVTYIRLRKS
jgi:hypothetical protein